MTETLECVTIEPTQPAKASVIWLHGLGADGNDFVPIISQMGLPEDLAIRFIFPHAPIRSITINGGMPMRSWCDILALKQDDIAINKDEFIESANQITHLIQQQSDAGIPFNKIIIAGFSLGGALAIHTGLCFDKRLAGVIALSTFLNEADYLETEAHSANKKLPIFMGHGTSDVIAPLSLGMKTYEALQKLNYSIDWHTYPMDHTVSREETKDIAKWIQKVLIDSTC